jgi:hypothetical protein
LYCYTFISHISSRASKVFAFLSPADFFSLLIPKSSRLFSRFPRRAEGLRV